MIAQTDPEIGPWLFSILDRQPVAPGEFLLALAQAAIRADAENYAILRLALRELRRKYPKYDPPPAAV